MESSFLTVSDHIKSVTGQRIISNPADHTYTHTQTYNLKRSHHRKQYHTFYHNKLCGKQKELVANTAIIYYNQIRVIISWL